MARDGEAHHLHRSGRIGDDDLKAVESRTGIELTRYGEGAERERPPGESADLLRHTGDTMTAYYRIESIGWYLVVEAAPVAVGVR